MTAPEVGDLWGTSLAISDNGNYIAVGANPADIEDSTDTGTDKGIVYIHKYNIT